MVKHEKRLRKQNIQARSCGVLVASKAELHAWRKSPGLHNPIVEGDVLMAPTKKGRKLDLSLGFTPVPQEENFTPNINEQSSVNTFTGQPRVGNVGSTTTKPTITSEAQAVQQDLSAVSGVPLATNRVTKFFLPKGEVTEQEFRRAKEEAKIVAEGGRRARATPGQLASFQVEQGEGFTPSLASPERQRGFTELTKDAFSSTIRDPLGNLGPDPEFSGEVRRSLPAAAFAALDVFRQFGSKATGLGSKKPLTTAQAQTTFNELASGLRADISDINAGTQDPSAVRVKLQLAQNAVNSYESYVKNYGYLDLNYWIDNGVEQQSDLRLMKETLTELQQDLQMARQAWLQRQFIAQPTFGT